MPPTMLKWARLFDSCFGYLQNHWTNSYKACVYSLNHCLIKGELHLPYTFSWSLWNIEESTQGHLSHLFYILCRLIKKKKLGVLPYPGVVG